jgi:hypothetical protein
MNKIVRTGVAALLLWAGSAFAQGIAFITNMKGDVAVDGNPRPLILSELARGQKIALGVDGQASVMYIATGKEYVLRVPGHYEVRDTEVVSSAGVPPMARSTEWRTSNKVLTHVAQTSSASVRMRSLASQKVDARPKLLFPTDGNIGTLQPVFRWTAADPKANAELTVLMSGQEKPLHRAKAAGGAYRMPVKLRPDTEYAWSVTAAAGEEIGSGRFRTLSADSIQAIEKRRPADKAEFSDRLLFALLLQEMGAAQEARESWSRLSQERNVQPELSALAE